MSALLEFAEKELRAAPGRMDWDRMMLHRDIVALVALFDVAQHLGCAAARVDPARERPGQPQADGTRDLRCRLTGRQSGHRHSACHRAQPRRSRTA